MIVICELNDVLIHTASGSTYPQGVWDLSFDDRVWNRLKSGVEKGIITGIGIVSNEGGIASGHQSKDSFDAKLNYIIYSLSEWVKLPVSQIKSVYCADYSDMRLPNPQMITGLMEFEFKCTKEDVLAIYLTSWMDQACTKLGVRKMSVDKFSMY